MVRALLDVVLDAVAVPSLDIPGAITITDVADYVFHNVLLFILSDSRDVVSTVSMGLPLVASVGDGHKLVTWRDSDPIRGDHIRNAAIIEVQRAKDRRQDSELAECLIRQIRT